MPVLEKKIDSRIAGFCLYLSFCAAELFLARGPFARILSYMSPPWQSVWLSNIFFAFLFGGIFPWGMTELVSRFTFRTLTPYLGAVCTDLKRSLRFFVIAANLVIAPLTLLYLISPLVAVAGAVVIPFVCYTGAFILYLFYVCRRYVDKPRRSRVLTQLGALYAIAYPLVATFFAGLPL
ncbi:MAG: hypothetical protein LBP26_01315 [Clostridiales bacterium]|jgi:hypothetical protein|nr:hypothetical protein [Clostridiales bacterium]